MLCALIAGAATVLAAGAEYRSRKSARRAEARAARRATESRLAMDLMYATCSLSLTTAKKLADLIRGMGAHVNLIPINPVDGSPFTATDAAAVKRFQETLTKLGVNATVRRRLGTDISAACGQLRRNAKKEVTVG